MFPFYAGASTVLFRGNAGAGEILETAQKNKITLLFSVPALYSAMLMETRQNYDLGSVRLAVSATNPLSSEIVRDWKKRFGIEILDGIGSTEVLHIYLSARPGAVRPGSTGQAVPGYELRIIDQSGVEVEPGAIGELLVAGESIAPYYWNSRSMTVNRMRGNWFYTGDNYRMDEQGFFWYAGRTHGLPRVSSQWVSPGEVANALMEHPFVLNAAVVPYKGKDHLETPGAFVILREGIAATPNLTRDLQDFVKERITPHRNPTGMCPGRQRVAGTALLIFLSKWSHSSGDSSDSGNRYLGGDSRRSRINVSSDSSRSIPAVSI
jgi:acyl-coenzyme A synthetase/AMP-(fatty) acid ligase